jgi:hypothetical protein
VICSHQRLEEAFRCRYVALWREHELNPVHLFVYGAVEILTILSDLEIGLINAIVSTGERQMRTDSSVDLG